MSGLKTYTPVTHKLFKSVDRRHQVHARDVRTVELFTRGRKSAEFFLIRGLTADLNQSDTRSLCGRGDCPPQ